MVDQLPDWEVTDNSGSTQAESGTATTTPANVPAVAGNRISGFMFQVDGDNVEISADGGSTYFEVPKKGTGFKDVKGNITQLSVRTSTGSTDYSFWIDFEDS